MKNKSLSYLIITNEYDYSHQVQKQINTLLKNKHWILNKVSPDYLFIIGGDGTFVRELQNYYNRDIKIVCINTGTVGFYYQFIGNKFTNFI
jgi:NAD+ kinase